MIIVFYPNQIEDLILLDLGKERFTSSCPLLNYLVGANNFQIECIITMDLD